MLGRLKEAGFLQSRAAPHAQNPGLEWNTTMTGGALTMASFLKPINRSRADALLAGVLDRAAAYNDEAGKPYLISEIAVFGSYLRAGSHRDRRRSNR